MGFNIEDYEPVEARIKAFWERYPEGRIHTELVHHDGQSFIVKASVWTDRQDPIPAAIDYAHEVIGSSQINRNFGLENCATSSIGRALADLNFAPKGKRPSREEMDKVNRVRRVEQEQVKAANPLDWGSPELPPEPPADDPFASWNPIEALGAEVIETKPRGSSPTAAGEPCTEKQQKLIRALFAEKYPDGDLKAFVNEISPMPIESLNDCSKWTASRVIEKLKG